MDAHLLTLATSPLDAIPPFLESLPKSVLSSLAAALAIGARARRTVKSTRRALASIAAWCARYRALTSAHAATCAAEFAKDSTEHFGKGSCDASALRDAFAASCHIMQEGAGSGIRVAPDAVLTCAHCVCGDDDPDDEVGSGAEDEDAPPLPPPHRIGRYKLLIFSTGECAVAKCVAVDAAADLALLTLVARSGGVGGGLGTYPRPPPLPTSAAGIKIVCVGNPSEFNERGGRITFNPPVFHTSHGRVVGPSDPERVASIGIGSLKHTAWTYWGHSGAALLSSTGAVVGLHSSWDSSSGSRHGVGVDEIRAFLAVAEAAEGGAGGAADAAANDAHLQLEGKGAAEPKPSAGAKRPARRL